MLTKAIRIHRRIALKGPSSRIETLLYITFVPLALAYGFFNWLRCQCYEIGLLPRYQSPVPVISVGNLAAGGTGKTPVVDYLLKKFISLGKRPAVVSRGYGGSFAGEVGIVSRGKGVLLTAAQAGDEPVLLARRNPAALVLIARKRAAGMKFAIDSLGADLLILDDGFQHLAVARDLDLVLLDGNRPLGNGLPLPAGLLREIPTALKRADLILLTRTDNADPAAMFNKAVYSCQHQLSNEAVGLDDKVMDLPGLKSKRLFAFAGIADPDSFFAALLEAGLTLGGQLACSDHAEYNAEAIAQIMTLATGCDGLITTEKDAVKLSAEMFDLPCYQVPLGIDVHKDELFFAEVKQYIRSI